MSVIRADNIIEEQTKEIQKALDRIEALIAVIKAGDADADENSRGTGISTTRLFKLGGRTLTMHSILFSVSQMTIDPDTDDHHKSISRRRLST